MEQATEVLRKSLLSFEKISFPVPSIKLSFNWIAPYKHYIFFFLYSNLKDGRDCVVFDTQKGTTNIIKTGLEAFEKANSSLCYWKDNIFVLYGGLVFGQSEGSQGIKFLSVIDIGGRISFRIQTCKPAGEERPDKDHHAHIYRDKMYIIGNKKKSVQFETIPTFDLNTRTWAEQPITKDIPEPCQNPTSVLFKGKIYFFGGTTPPPPEDVQAQAKEDMKPQAKEDVKLQQTAGSGTLSNIFSGGEGARPGSLFGNKESTGGSSLFGSQTGAGGSCPLSFATKMGSTGGSSLFGSQTGAGGSGPLSFATKMGSTGGSDLLSFATKMGSTGGSSLFGSQTGVGGSGLLANATNKGSIGGSSLFSKRVALDLFVLDLETMEWQQIHKQSFLPTCPTSIRDHFFAEVFGDKVFISHRNFMQSFIYDPANNNTLNSEGLSFKDQWRVRSFGEHSLLFRTLIEKDSSWLEYHNLAQPEKQEEKVTTSQQLSEPQPEKKEEKVTPSQQLSEPQPEKKEEKVTPSQQLSEPQPEKQEEKVTASQQPSEPQPEKKEEKVAPYQKPPEIKEKPSAERNESRLQAHSEILRRSLLSFRKAPFPRVELTYTAAYKHFLIIFPLSRLPDGADCVVLDTENGTTQTLQTGLQLQQRFDKGFCYWKDNIFVFYGGLFSETYSRRNANEDLDVHLLYVIENEGKISFETKSCHLTDPKWWANFRVIHIYQDNMYILNTRRSTHHEVLNKFDLNKEEWSECQTTGEIPTYDNRDTPKTVLLNGKIYVSAPKVEEAISRGGGSSLFGNRNPESWVLFALDLENYKWQQIHKDSSIPREIKIGWSSKVVGDRIFKSHQDYDEFWIYNPANNQVSKSEGFPGREEWEIESSKSHLIIFRFTGDSTRKEIEYQNIAISAQSQEEEEKSLLSDPLVASYQQLPHMEYIWKEKPFADITFVVGTEEISAHRAILLKCRYFQNMFKSGMIEATSNKITVPDISSVNFKAILEYIYCDKIALTEALAMELIILADMYSLPNLKADCEKFLSEKLSVSNFVEVMKVSQTADSEKLEKRIVSFLTSNIEKVKQEIDISVIPPELFIKAIVDLKSNKR